MPEEKFNDAVITSFVRNISSTPVSVTKLLYLKEKTYSTYQIVASNFQDKLFHYRLRDWNFFFLSFIFSWCFLPSDVEEFSPSCSTDTEAIKRETQVPRGTKEIEEEDDDDNNKKEKSERKKDQKKNETEVAKDEEFS
uniref:Uncharacterized protein n=1 Tax=Araneus ventricosus TaxID=182803 RepID=A0A4Y2QIM8_ARAVE|nr:hypothetical protein AVEN_167290-1 [Araneus ventricosus]